MGSTLSDAREGEVVSCCVSERKGIRKHAVDAIELRVGVGIEGDAHAGNWHRQISMLAEESVDTMRAVWSSRRGTSPRTS